MALRGDDEHAVIGHPLASEPFQACAHIVTQRWRMTDVETKLHRGAEFVDVLPAGPGGTDEPLLQLVLVDADSVGYADHARIVHGRGPTRGITTLPPDTASRAPCLLRRRAGRTDRRRADARQ